MGGANSIFLTQPGIFEAMLKVNTLQLLTLFFTGVLAGFEVAVHYCLVSPPSLTEAGRILLRQAMILRVRLLAPALFFPALAFGISLTVQERQLQAVWLHAVAIALFAVWIVIRIVRTVPVNSATLKWNPNAPPADWQELIERAERYHVVAAWASVIAFLCFLLPVVQRR